MEQESKHDEDDRAAIHALLDRAGIPSADWAACDDVECNSHLYHRVKWLLETAGLLVGQHTEGNE